MTGSLPLGHGNLQGGISEEGARQATPTGPDARWTNPADRPSPGPGSPHRRDDSLKRTEELGGGGEADRRYEGEDDAGREPDAAVAGDPGSDPRPYAVT